MKVMKLLKVYEGRSKNGIQSKESLNLLHIPTKVEATL